jgi:hypothetical protein
LIAILGFHAQTKKEASSMPRTLKDTGLESADRRLLRDVRDLGWHVVLIPEEEGTPGWAFSVGLYSSFSAPEVIVFGLDLDVAHQLINGVGELAKSGSPVIEREIRAELIDRYDCTFRTVVQQWYPAFMGAACWYYRSTEFPLLQCFWPDRSGLYPWSRDFQKSWKWAQPLLYNSSRRRARVDALLKSLGE